MFKQKIAIASIALAMGLSLTLPAANAADKPLKAIGITVGSLGNPYFVTIVKGAEAKAKQINPGVNVTAVSADYDMMLYREEQFGPIIPVAPFDDVETALEYVTASDHGQQVSIFGSDPTQIGALVDPLVNQVCRVNLNCQCQRGPDVFPFAGRKDSAEGTLSVTDALRAFSIRSMVAAKQTDNSKALLEAIVTDRDSKFVNTGFIL